MEGSNNVGVEVNQTTSHMASCPHTFICLSYSDSVCFKRKLNENGTVSRNKVRLVIKGYLQGPVEETYSPIVDFATVRTVLAVSTQKGFLTRQRDIRTAFLHGDVDEEVFVSPPS